MTSKSLLAVPAIVLLLALSGCAGIGEDAQVSCVPLDASRSTRYIEPEYEVLFREHIEQVAEEGGTVAAVVLTGAPRVEAIVRSEDFSEFTGEEKQGERSRAVRRFVSQIAAEAKQSLLGSQNPSEGSGIVDGIDLLADRGECDSVLALSDGLETAAFHTEHANLDDPAARRHLVERLQDRGLVPDLEGAPLSFPLGGVLPQGTNIPEGVLAGSRAFWELYAEAAGADLEWRTGG